MGLYFEAHITVEPLSGDDLNHFKMVSEIYGFKAADLYMVKDREGTPERSNKDTFTTARSDDLQDILERTQNLVWKLQLDGIKVWRWKIEDTLIDVKLDH